MFKDQPYDDKMKQIFASTSKEGFAGNIFKIDVVLSGFCIQTKVQEYATELKEFCSIFSPWILKENLIKA